MDKNDIAGLILFATICTIIGFALGMSQRNHFTLNDTRYEQVGVMTIHDNGNTLYVPVFKPKNPRGN